MIPRSRLTPPRLSRVAQALSLTLVLGWLGGVALDAYHLSTAQHAACAEHGDIVEAGSVGHSSIDARAAKSVDETSARIRSGKWENGAVETAHQHCATPLLHSASAAPHRRSSLLAQVPKAFLPGEITFVRPPIHDDRPWLTAPKTSPPLVRA